MPAKSKRNIPRSDLLKAANWRRRAEECRVESEATTNDSARRAMVLIARFYDELASLLDVQAEQSPVNKKRRKTGPQQR
jgi:hypothetical protein